MFSGHYELFLFLPVAVSLVISKCVLLIRLAEIIFSSDCHFGSTLNIYKYIQMLG